MGERPRLTTRGYVCNQCGRQAKALRWNVEAYNTGPHVDEQPVCCGSPMAEIDDRPANTLMIATDDIPGGLDVPHAICHEDGTPKRYYSKSAIRKAANEAGWTISGETPHVRQEHVDRRGADKEQRLHNSREAVRQATRELSRGR